MLFSRDGFFIGENMKDRLIGLNLQGQYGKALVEAGHFYADNPVGQEHQLGIRVGQAVTSALSELGLEVATCLLVDDYNVPDLYSSANVSRYTEWGYVPDHVYRERDLAPEANIILQMLTDRGKVKKQKNGRVHLTVEGYPLLVDANRSMNPLSCALLDSVLYAKKLKEHGGLCVTVIPQQFAVQQVVTRKILSAAGFNVPILNVYYDRNGLVHVEI